MLMADVSTGRSYPSLASSGSGLWRRLASSSRPRSPPTNRPPIHPDVDPPPLPRRRFQLLAFALIVFFASLQFLPATHFRDPADPHRTWVPLHPNRTATSSIYSSSAHEDGSNIKNDSADETIHIFSWISCLDLRLLVVLANSTLSSSRFQENLYFHFIIPKDEDTKLSFYKLKVLLPDAKLDIIGQSIIEEKLRIAFPEERLFWPSLHEIAPLIIPTIEPSLSRFLYLSPDIIIKGEIEDLFHVDLSPYSVAAAEDCTVKLGNYVNMDIVNAIQRTSAKSWVSKDPYDESACKPDLDFLVIDAKMLDKNLMKVISWWSKVLNLGNERSSEIHPAIALALYNKYLRLSSSWKPSNSILSVTNSEAKVLHFDGPRKTCTKHEVKHQGSEFGNNWQQYLDPKSDVILTN